MRVLRENLGEQGKAAKLWTEIVEDYPECECIDSERQMIAHW